MQIYDGYIEKKISNQKEFNKTKTQIGHLYEISRVEKRPKDIRKINLTNK
jgi:hypothetical protein